MKLANAIKITAIFLICLFFILTVSTCAWLSRWSPYGGEVAELMFKQAIGIATIPDLRRLGAIHNTKHEYTYAESVYQEMLRREPRNLLAAANLAMAKTHLGKHEEAVKYYQDIIDVGGGAVDIYFYYAKSLGALGRVSEAIDWRYNCLSTSDRLVDNVYDLVQGLIEMKRLTEALSVVDGYTMTHPRRKAYFAAQRVLLQNALRSSRESQGEAHNVQLPQIQNHYFAPVRVMNAREVQTFLVDTGATFFSVPQTFFKDMGIREPEAEQMVQMTTANGATMTGKLVTFDKINIGPIELQNVKAVVCHDCAMLLGQSVLSRLRMATKEKNGVNFLELSRHP